MLPLMLPLLLRPMGRVVPAVCCGLRLPRPCTSLRRCSRLRLGLLHAHPQRAKVSLKQLSSKLVIAV